MLGGDRSGDRRGRAASCHTGGDGGLACSGDMLLQALVACAGVTLRSVAINRGLIVGGSVRAEGDLDFRGTLGVERDAPVGFTAIRLHFDLRDLGPSRGSSRDRFHDRAPTAFCCRRWQGHRASRSTLRLALPKNGPPSSRLPHTPQTALALGTLGQVITGLAHWGTLWADSLLRRTWRLASARAKSQPLCAQSRPLFLVEHEFRIDDDLGLRNLLGFGM